MEKPKFLIIGLLFILYSCSTKEDNTLFNFDIIAITEVEVPVEFEINSMAEIKTYYIQKSLCHVFYDYIFRQIKENEIEVYLAETYIENGECKEENYTVLRSFQIEIENYETYTLKFWNGRNEQGENQFITIEVPVIQ